MHFPYTVRHFAPLSSDLYSITATEFYSLIYTISSLLLSLIFLAFIVNLSAALMLKSLPPVSLNLLSFNVFYKINDVITNRGIHLINHAYFYALSEVAVHSKSIEEVKLNATLISEFFNEGWKKIRGI